MSSSRRRGFAFKEIIIVSIVGLLVSNFISLNDGKKTWKQEPKIAWQADDAAAVQALLVGSSDARFDNKTLHLIHVFNPYVMKKSSASPSSNNISNTAPSFSSAAMLEQIGLEQWMTIQSVHRALQHVPTTTMTVDVICAVFESDLAELASLPCRKVLLTRSTLDEYPYLKPPRKLPFLQEILEVSTKHLNYAQDFYWLYTNSDIGLSRGFYSYLKAQLIHAPSRYNTHRDALSINRVTIPLPPKTVQKNLDASSQAWLSYIDKNIARGKKHPGYDAFCMHSSVLQRIHLGDFFAGHPPWGTNFHYMLLLMANNYANVKSNPMGTFHLGDEMAWKVNDENVTVWDAPTVRHCPARPSALTAYSVQNAINCGKWFYHGGRTYHNQTIPFFVQPGYEGIYLKRAKHLINYTESGHPKLIRKQPSSNKTNTALANFLNNNRQQLLGMGGGKKNTHLLHERIRERTAKKHERMEAKKNLMLNGQMEAQQLRRDKSIARFDASPYTTRPGVDTTSNSDSSSPGLTQQPRLEQKGAAVGSNGGISSHRPFKGRGIGVVLNNDNNKASPSPRLSEAWKDRKAAPRQTRGKNHVYGPKKSP